MHKVTSVSRDTTPTALNRVCGLLYMTGKELIVAKADA